MRNSRSVDLMSLQADLLSARLLFPEKTFHINRHVHFVNHMCTKHFACGLEENNICIEFLKESAHSTKYNTAYRSEILDNEKHYITHPQLSMT